VKRNKVEIQQSAQKPVSLEVPKAEAQQKQESEHVKEEVK